MSQIMYGSPDLDVLRFFQENLRELLCKAELNNDEFLYNSSVLATFASVSTHSSQSFFPSPSTLTSVLDNFILGRGIRGDPILMETAGAQCLLMTGFFQPQINGSHQAWPTLRDLRGWSREGSTFFWQASQTTRDAQKAELLERMASHFELWRRIDASLARKLKREALSLKPS